MTPRGIKALNEIADKAQLDVWRSRNKLMLEAVIAAWMDTDDAFTVADILRQHADQLTEYL